MLMLRMNVWKRKLATEQRLVFPLLLSVYDGVVLRNLINQPEHLHGEIKYFRTATR